MLSVVRHRRPVSPHLGRHLALAPAEHPVVVGAGMAGLVAVSVLRRRTREARDEPRVLGIGF